MTNERNGKMDDTEKQRNDRTSTYLAIGLAAIALFLYVYAWIRFRY